MRLVAAFHIPFSAHIVVAGTQSNTGHLPADRNLGVDPRNSLEERGNLKFAGEFPAATWRAKVINMRAASAVGFGLAIAIGMSAPLAVADEATKISVTLKDHKFSPAEPSAPAGKPIVIEVENQDKTPAEFESKALRVEKVVPGGGKISVQVRALPAGRYRFFDDYHESTTEGFLVTQ